MGLTYARAFHQYGIVRRDQLILVEKDAARRDSLDQLQLGIVIDQPSEALKRCQVILLAVKPQDIEQLVPALQNILQADQVVFSIMAGITMARLQSSLRHPLIVRAMPNLAAKIGMGMTAFSALPEVDRQHLHWAETLLDTTGRSLYLEEERLLDAVTAVSGSGPAYFFYIVQEMLEAAVQLGLDEVTAGVLIKQTMLGSYHLLNQGPESPADLIRSVSSKGGTTEAAFSVFREGRLGEILRSGIARAEERARELSNSA